MKVNEIIKKRRKELGLTLKQVAEKLGVSESLISRYESNDVKNMGIDKIIPLAKVLDTTPAFLMGWETKKEKENINIDTATTDYIIIPLYSSISAGYGASDVDFIEMIPVFNLKKNGTEYFAVKVAGDSMEPKIPNGSTIIIKKDIAIENGEIGAFCLNDENFVKQKKLIKDKLVLHSFNLAYDDKLVGKYDEFKEYGKVVKVMIDL